MEVWHGAARSTRRSSGEAHARAAPLLGTTSAACFACVMPHAPAFAPLAVRGPQPMPMAQRAQSVSLPRRHALPRHDCCYCYYYFYYYYYYYVIINIVIIIIIINKIL